MPLSSFVSSFSLLVAGHFLLGMETGGDQGQPDIVAHVRVQHHAEDNIGLRVHRLPDDFGGIIDLVEGQVGCRRC